jgi:hypothetical protein
MKHTRTKRHMLLLPVFLVAVVALILGATAPVSWGFGGWGEFADAEIFFEENTTDEDLGIQVFLDGEAWRSVTILTPDWRRLVKVRARGSAGMIGLTELFSESAEPGYDNEAERQAFLDLFPPGEYRFFGWAVEGEILVGTATLTHNIPAAPVITSPPDEDEPTLDPENPEIVWNLIDGIAVQVIVEFVELDDEEEETGRVFEFAVDLPATATSVTIPEEFLESLEELDGEYKVEVLAIEASGNKAITEREFELAEEE